MCNVARSERINLGATLALVASLALGACGEGENNLPQLADPTNETSTLPELTTTSTPAASTLPELTTRTTTGLPPLPETAGGDTHGNAEASDELSPETILESGVLQPLSFTAQSLIDSGRGSIDHYPGSFSGDDYYEGYYELNTENSDGLIIFFSITAPGDESGPDLNNIQHLYAVVSDPSAETEAGLAVLYYIDLSRTEIDGVERLDASGNLNGTTFTTHSETMDEADPAAVTDPRQAAELAVQTAASIIATLDR